MKITRMCYNDDGALIPGILIQCAFRKPVFYAVEPSCGWNSQIITNDEKKNLYPYAEVIPKFDASDIDKMFTEKK